MSSSLLTMFHHSRYFTKFNGLLPLPTPSPTLSFSPLPKIEHEKLFPVNANKVDFELSLQSSHKLHNVPLICYVKTGFRVQHELLNWCIVKYLTRGWKPTIRMLARAFCRNRRDFQMKTKYRTTMISISLCAGNVYLRFINHLF